MYLIYKIKIVSFSDLFIIALTTPKSTVSNSCPARLLSSLSRGLAYSTLTRAMI